MSRKRKRRSVYRTRRPVSGTTGDQSCPVWADVCSRRMSVVGYTPGGAPYGTFEDEMDADTGNLEVDE